MDQPELLQGRDDASRRLNRRALIVIAAAFVAMAAAGAVLQIAPYIVSDVVSKLFGAAFFVSVGAYFLFRGEPRSPVPTHSLVRGQDP